MSGQVLRFDAKATGPAGEPVQIGDWYLADYGFQVVTGRVISITPAGLILAFRWGTFMRGPHFVRYGAIHGRVPDPRWLRRLFGKRSS